MKRITGQFVFLIWVLFLLSMAGCGGSGSGSPANRWSAGGGDTQSPPEVTAIKPSNPRAGDTCVISGKNFGEYDPATCDVTFGGVSARIIEKRSIEGWVNDQIVVKAPSSAPPSGYVLVTNSSGTSTSDSSSAYTRTYQWRGVAPVDGGYGGAGVTTGAFDPRESQQNDFLLLYSDAESSGGEIGLWGRRYIDSQEGWSAAVRVDPDDGNNAALPDISMNSNGNAICVWVEQAATDQVLASYYDPSTSSWGTSLRLDSGNAGLASPNPRVAFLQNGDAWVVWVEDDGVSQDGIFARMYDHTKSWGDAAWGAPIRLDWDTGNPGENAQNPDIAFEHGSSRGFCVFEKKFGGVARSCYADYGITAAEWSPPNPPGKPQTLDTAGALPDRTPRVVFDSNGNAMAIFVDNIGGNDRVAANRYATGGAWSGSVAIDNNSGAAWAPEVIFDYQGNAFAAFLEPSGVNGDKVFTCKYSAASNQWDAAPARLDNTAIDQQCTSLNMAMDPTGNRAACLFVKQNDAGIESEIFVNRCDTALNTWSGAERIDDSPGYVAAAFPLAAIDTGYNLFAFWAGGLTTQRTFYNYYH